MPSVPAGAPRVEISVAAHVPLGEPLPVTVRVTNPGNRPLELHLQGRSITFDIVVRREQDGRMVWRRLHGSALPAILQLRVLAPGESLELSDTWDQRGSDGEQVAVGRYTVQGEVPTDEPEPMRTPVASLRIGS